jgi:hypothetical protein
MNSSFLTLVSNLSASMTVDPLVAWPLSTLNGSQFHMPITGAGAGRSYTPILTGAAANCTADAEVMYSGGVAAPPMLTNRNNQRGGSVSNDRAFVAGGDQVKERRREREKKR